MRYVSSLVLLAVVMAGCGQIGAAKSECGVQKKVMIVTGVDHPAHNWRQTKVALSNVLKADSRLSVDVVEDPNWLADGSLEEYDAVVIHFMNWERPSPGQQARTNLERFVKKGRGLLILHFGCGAFQDWPEYRNIAGRVWDPKLRAHDPKGVFRVDIVDDGHPITKGLKWFETDDELYTCLAGERPIRLLATAKSKVDGKDYPMVFVLNYGEGRVFHCLLGHDVKAIENPPVAELLRRGCAWATGGEIRNQNAK